MHIADSILRDVKEGKIADIFAEPDKTKVLLQLKELELIKISEAGVSITNEGEIAVEKGIKSYFAYKKTTRSLPDRPEKEERKTDALSLLGVVIAVPATLLLLLLFLMLLVLDLEQL